MGQVPSGKGSSVKRHLLCIVPENCCMPRMPNSVKMKSMKTTAFSSELTEPTSELTS